MNNSRSITLLLIANAISGISQGITMIAIPWYFTGILHKEGLFGSIYFAVTALSLFWGVYAGALIDRYDRRKIFLAMNITGFLLLGGIALKGFYTPLSWEFVAMPFAITAFIYNIHFPNMYAFVQEITPKEQYAKVNSMLEVQGQISFTLAGGAAAILLNGISGNGINIRGISLFEGLKIAPWQIHEIFMLDACTYVVALLMIYFITTLPVSVKQIDTTPLRERLQTGFKYLKQHPILLRFGFLSLQLFLTILIFGTYLSPIYVDLFLAKGGDVYAIGDMVFSIGALIAGLITARVIQPKYSVRTIMVMNLIAGCMFLAMIATKLVALFYIVYFIVGFCNAGVRILRVTYLFNHIPNNIIGRSTSAFFVLNVIARMILIGLFSLPMFHTPVGVIIPVVILAAICFLAVIGLQYDYEKLQHS